MTKQHPPSQPVVDSWSCPTTVYAGENSIGQLAALLGDRPVLVVTDHRVWLHSSIAAAVRSSLEAAQSAPHVVARDFGASDDEFLAAVTRRLRDVPGGIVLGLGGGSVLDIARLAALAADDPDFAGVLASWRTGSSLPAVLMWPAGRDAGCDCVCIPTTFGTAAEVSPVAVLRRGQATTLVVSPALRAHAAVLDTSAGATLGAGAARAGLLEPMSRVLVPAVAGGPLELQDRVGRALFETLIHLGRPGARLEAGWRLAAALTSAQTHTAFLSLGRSPFGHALWPCATELMAATGASKPMVLSWLLPAWAQGLVSGQLHSPVFGSPERLAAITGWPAAEVPDRLAEWCAGLELREGHGSEVLPEVDASGVAAAVVGTWQASGWFLAGAATAELEWLLAAATG